MPSSSLSLKSPLRQSEEGSEARWLWTKQRNNLKAAEWNQTTNRGLSHLDKLTGRIDKEGQIAKIKPVPAVDTPIPLIKCSSSQ